MKKLAKKILARLGLKVNRIDRSRVLEEDKFKWLQGLDIQTVLDIGSNKGNTVREFHRLFPQAAIYAFEPLADCLELVKSKMAGVPNIYFYKLALSDHEGEATFYRSEYSGSSSLLPMASLHKTLFPHTAKQFPEKVRVTTLDKILADKNLESNILVKIDVQGEEGKVIAGGQKIISRAKVIICETSYQPLYDGQALFGDIFKQLTALGFVYAGLWGEDFHSPQDGRPLQQDSIFLKVSNF